jgi:CMP-N-acetylneuraminic acid synthetase
MKSLAGKPVVSYAVSAMKACPLVDRRVFVTEDAKLAARVSKMGMETILRPPELAQSTKAIEATIQYVLEELKRTKQYVPDIVVVLFVTSPLVTSEHIEEAIDTMLIFNADTVISAREDRKFHYLHGADGLQPLFKKRLLKFEKELLFEETGSLIVTRRDAVTSGSVHGKRVGHILLTPDEAIDIESGFEFWMAEQVLRNAKAVHKLE